MAQLLPQGKQQYFDNAGAPLAGGKLYTYESGTATFKTTWADAGKVTANTNPVILDARGEAVVFWDGVYTVALKTAADADVWTVDGIATPEESGSAAALRADLASTSSGDGASLIGMEGGGTVADALKFLVYAGSGSDDTAALQARDMDAAASGLALVLSGQITVSTAITFAARVVPGWGARITTSGAGGGTKWLKFAAGCDAAPGQYWLNTDWPTQFLAIDRIYPQWFGSCGGAAEDSSAALIRAFRACRAGFASASDKTDKTLGCRVVWFMSGTYRCKNVPVYACTNIDGEWGGSPYGPTILQIDYNDPGLRFVPKNYGLNDAVINSSVGQNYVHNVRLGTETPASTFEGEPVCFFMSPAQATTYLGITGDNSGGNVGHIDTQFVHTWWKNGNTCIYCDEGMLWLHLRDNTFDVAYRAVRHTGTAKGMVRSYGNIYYGCIRGALENTSSEATLGVRWEMFDDEFKAGNTYSATVDWRRALNFNPSAYVSGTYVRIRGGNFLKQTSMGLNIGGPIFVKNAQDVDIEVEMTDPDCTNVQKAIAIQDNVQHCRIAGKIVSKALASYTSASLIQFSQSTQTLTDIRLDVDLVNENATAIPAAIDSNFVLTGVDMDRVLTAGNFTARTGVNISGRPKSAPTVASSATLILPPGEDVFVISGTTGITGITATGWTGRTVRLVFQGSLTVTDGSNLKLAGDFVTTANDVLTLTCDGTNWYECSRSAN